MGSMYIETTYKLLAVTWVPCILRQPILVVISSHMCPMYIETPYISRVISSHMCPMYIETHYIIRVISSHMGPMYLETSYICSY